MIFSSCSRPMPLKSANVPRNNVVVGARLRAIRACREPIARKRAPKGAPLFLYAIASWCVGYLYDSLISGFG